MAFYRCCSGGKGVLTPVAFDGIFGKGNVQVKDGRYLFGFSDSQDMAGEDVMYPSSQGVKPVYDRSKPFVLHVRAKCSAQLTRGQCICGNSQNYFNMPSIEFQASNSGNVFWAGWSTDGSSWTTAFEIKPNEMPFVANQWYDIDYSWDGTTAKFEVFDGTNTVTKTANVGQFFSTTAGWMALGTVAKNRYLVASNVTIDLYNTYWEEDGVLLWGNKGGYNVNDNIADAFDNTKTYAVGDAVIYNNALYICNTAVSTAGAFDVSKWTKTNITNIGYGVVHTKEVSGTLDSNGYLDGTGLLLTDAVIGVVAYDSTSAQEILGAGAYAFAFANVGLGTQTLRFLNWNFSNQFGGKYIKCTVAYIPTA